MNKTTLIFVFFLFNSFYLGAQSEIIFYPKALEKELQKNYNKSFEIKEATFTSSVANKLKYGKYFTISQSADNEILEYIYVGRVKTCRAGGCAIGTNQSDESQSEYFDYFMRFDTTLFVKQVKVYNYQATHGQEITAKSWLKQFFAYNGKTALNAGKNVDAISGATISVDAITADIEHKTLLLQKALGNMDRQVSESKMK